MVIGVGPGHLDLVVEGALADLDGVPAQEMAAIEIVNRALKDEDERALALAGKLMDVISATASRSAASAMALVIRRSDRKCGIGGANSSASSLVTGVVFDVRTQVLEIVVVAVALGVCSE